MEYYKKKCETDPEHRAKMNERKKAEYKERNIRECGDEVLYQMYCRPGRPRKYGVEPTLEHYIISTPSTTANNSTNGSGDES